jgi:DNA-binding beta-propeller fold protein YncE
MESFWLPYSVTVDPSGRFAYVANSGGFLFGPSGVIDPDNRYRGGAVSQYRIEADGTLRPLSLAIAAAGDASGAVIAVDGSE